jgi:hypothetical protein
MPMNFEELDEKTRKCMLAEFEAEEASGKPYRSKALSDEGRSAFPTIMRDAIVEGNEETLADSLAKPKYWSQSESYVRNGVTRTRPINVQAAAERPAVTEFNTWYVRGLAKRLMDERVTQCQVYRAAPPKWEPAECSKHEGHVYSVQELHDGHRAKYWPEPGKPNAFSIPAGPSCHHTIRRVPMADP